MIAFILAALAQEQIDNPEFKSGASFKPCSSVTFKGETPGGPTGYEQKVTLKSVADAELVLATEIFLNGKAMGNATERKVAAKIASDEMKKLKEGEEEI